MQTWLHWPIKIDSFSFSFNVEDFNLLENFANLWEFARNGKTFLLGTVETLLVTSCRGIEVWQNWASRANLEHLLCKVYDCELDVTHLFLFFFSLSENLPHIRCKNWPWWYPKWTPLYYYWTKNFHWKWDCNIFVWTSLQAGRKSEAEMYEIWTLVW